MPLSFTRLLLCLKRCHACDQCHSCRVFTPLTGSHCKLRPNTEGKPTSLASNYPLLGRKCLSWEGGTRVFAFIAGGLLPAHLHGTTNTQLMHVADWYPTLCGLAGVVAKDDWIDPNTNITHPIDGVDVWPTLISNGRTPVARQWLPTTARCSSLSITTNTNTP
jgi:hypothetical protein